MPGGATSHPIGAPAAPGSVLSVFNRYRERGGEEEAFEAEADLLERHGWRVERLTVRSREPAGFGDRLRLARDALWSPGWRREMARRLAGKRPDLVHVHNAFPVISPAVVHACREARVPVVHSLHNYRLLCAAATLHRDGRSCHDCVGRVPWPAVLHRCYHGSAARSGVAAASQVLHRVLGTWSRAVDLFIVGTELARRVIVEGGLPSRRVAVKPNFVHPDPGAAEGPGEYALFAGRLSTVKGVPDLLAAWGECEVPLRIVGGGPLEATVREWARRPGVEYRGRAERAEVLKLLRRARFLVFPSRWYEVAPLVLLEAFACGVPVVAATGGAAEEMLEGGALGWTFPAGDPAALASVARAVWADPAGARERGRRARRAFEAKYGAEANYRRLAELYQRVLRRDGAADRTSPDKGDRDAA